MSKTILLLHVQLWKNKQTCSVCYKTFQSQSHCNMFPLEVRLKKNKVTPVSATLEIARKMCQKNRRHI